MHIGIDMGGTNVRVALVDNNGIVNNITEPTLSTQSVEETTNHIKSIIHKLIIPQVKGIGMGVPSAVDIERGIVYNVANIPSWKEVHIKDILEKEFKIPTFVNNDANCFALGEKYFGKAKPYKNTVGITLGTGVGAGIIINNELYAGSNTCAGEIGCLPYLDDIYEHYCSSQFFVKKHDSTAKDLFHLAMNGDSKARQIWSEFGGHIAQLISLVLFTYDPQIIVFGGSIAKAYSLFSDSVNKNLTNFLFPNVIEKLKIEVSNTKDVGILGAASLVNVR